MSTEEIKKNQIPARKNLRKSILKKQIQKRKVNSKQRRRKKK